ncbi:MAG: cupin domain-containing protein [Nitrospirae bacterium]|nr:cupin domain-containing protein [Nitrospirota bacterium]
MKTLKQLLFIALMGLLFVTVAAAEEKGNQPTTPGPATTYQAKMPVTLPGGEYDQMTLIIDFPPGAGFPEHMHGGYVLVIVLQGEITIKEKGSEKTIKAGESWTEAPGNLHSAVNAGASTARVVVNMLLPKGAEATTIIKQ